MFKVEIDNEKIGAYLSEQISRRYPSRRQFCIAYICAAGEEPTDERVNSLTNRFSKICQGKNSVQTHDLPFLSALLELSCEQILSAGECGVPLSRRVTNYSVAASGESAEWEKYIHRKDKLILNADEYGNTVIDYALQFGNYPFLKYLMDKEYIWFDSGKETDYCVTFGAGTSIQRRNASEIDCGLAHALRSEDTLRMSMIAIAADNEDVAMLDKLRAREIPQLYCNAHYSGSHPDFDSHYDRETERMVRHIAGAGSAVLDYFTDSFSIRDKMRYKDGSERTHTFLFPYLSQLLDLLIAQKSPFAETALRKALRYNREVYQRLHTLIAAVKNDEFYAREECRSLWISDCRKGLNFFENGNIILFCAFYSSLVNPMDGLITNIACVTETPSSASLKRLAEELNESFAAIRDLRDNLEEAMTE